MPTHIDHKSLGGVIDLMTRHRLRPIACPETEKDAIDAYARPRGLPYLAWFAHRRARHLQEGWAVMPIDDEGMSVELTAMLSCANPNAKGQQFVESVTRPQA